MSRTARPLWLLLPILTIVLALIYLLLPKERGASISEVPLSLEAIQQRGQLTILTRNTSTTYYSEDDTLAGPEFELASSFATYLGVKAEFVVKQSMTELLEAVQRGEGQMAAGGISRTEEREAIYNFAADYDQVQQQLVCNRDLKQPKGNEDLLGLQLMVLAASSYEETLQEWQKQQPELSWQSRNDLSTEQILQKVAAKEIDCTLADSNIVAINQRYFPELAIAFAPFETPESLAWVLPPGADELKAKIREWLEKISESGELIAIKEHYYGHIQLFDYVDMSVYQRRIRERLPRYRTLFEAAAEEHDLPWTLLAAQAYQESHWDPHAKSPTGVRGMMMLTRNTAKAMEIKDRLDPKQSINGGATYLKRMLARLPASIAEEDRRWFALAAYNVGFAHLRDARTLAKKLNRNPDLWHEVEEVLPLLSQKKYYKQLKYGYARGLEPVRYVQRIRNYEEVLKHIELAEAEEP